MCKKFQSQWKWSFSFSSSFMINSVFRNYAININDSCQQQLPVLAVLWNAKQCAAAFSAYIWLIDHKGEVMWCSGILGAPALWHGFERMITSDLQHDCRVKNLRKTKKIKPGLLWSHKRSLEKLNKNMQCHYILDDL